MDSIKVYNKSNFKESQHDRVDRIKARLVDILNLLHHADISLTSDRDIQSMYNDSYLNVPIGDVLNISPGIYTLITEVYEGSPMYLVKSFDFLRTSLRGLYSVEHQLCKAITLLGYHYCFLRKATPLNPAFQYHFPNIHNLIKSYNNFQQSYFYERLLDLINHCKDDDVNLKMFSISGVYIYWLMTLAELERDVSGLPKEVFPEVEAIGLYGRLLLKTLTEGTSPCE